MQYYETNSVLKYGKLQNMYYHSSLMCIRKQNPGFVPVTDLILGADVQHRKQHT
jgi:hypothetical protein